ncbi:unknown [Bacteroides sp. CAG:633]|nr:unknown [Bacteroides sp. CAG:633]
MLTTPWSQGSLPKIIHSDGYHIVSLHCIRSKVDTESCISTCMASSQPSIDINFCFLKNAIEFQKKPLRQVFSFQLKVFPIPAIAYIKIFR